MRKILDSLLFSYVYPILSKGKTKYLEVSDAFPLPPQLVEALNQSSKFQLNLAGPWKFLLSCFELGRNKLAIIPRRMWVLPLIFVFLRVIIFVNQPLLIKRLVEQLSNKENILNIILTALLFTFFLLLHNVLTQHYYFRYLNIYQKIRASISMKLYYHTLGIKYKTACKIQSGDVVNHLASDADAIAEVHNGVFELIYSVCIITGGAFILYSLMGIYGLISFSLFFLFLPITRKVAKLFANFDNEMMLHSDKRITLISQVINSIRIVKYFSLEKSVLAEIGKIRAKEINAMKRFAKGEALGTVIYSGSSSLVCIIGFYLYTKHTGNIELAIIFSALATFFMVGENIGHLSQVLFVFIRAKVGAERLIKYFSHESESLPELEQKNANTHSSPNTSISLVVNNLSAGYELNKNFINSMSFYVKESESVAIIGMVGTGKTTLLLALLNELFSTGEINYFSNNLKVIPKIAYVSQEPFILNATLKDNLLFGHDRDMEAVNQALYLTALDKDVEHLPNGIDTEIGEKGVNLSGGQKQRVTMARAVLSEPNIILLDDPFSAVDFSTEKLLFERLIENKWKNITKIVVTHRLNNLAKFDKIVLLEQGKIIAQGSYAELSDTSPEFKYFMQHHIEIEQDKTKNLELNVLQNKKYSDNFTEDEDKEVGKVKSNVYKLYVSALGGETKWKKYILLSLMLLVVTNALFPSFVNSWFAFWHDVSFLNKLFTPLNAVVAFAIMQFCGMFLVFGDRIYSTMRTIAAASLIHDNALKSVLHAPIRFFDSNPSGRILNRFSRDVGVVQTELLWATYSTVSTFLQVVITLTILVLSAPVIILVIIPSSYFYYKIQNTYRKSAREIKRLDSISRSPFISLFKETYTGLILIRSYTRFSEFSETFKQRLGTNLSLFNTHVLINRWFSIRVPLISAGVVGFSVISLIFSVRYSYLTAGICGFIFSYLLWFTENLNWMIRGFADLETRITSVERLNTYAKLIPEKSILTDKAVALLPNWPEKGEIIFDNVSARYAEDLPLILKNLSFKVEGKTKVGLIGRTGSGKSTIFQALFRLIDLEYGQIYIDGINIASIPLEVLRAVIAIIPQDPSLFLGTIRSNIDVNNSVPDLEIWRILEKTCLADFVKSLPEGLNSEVGENGKNLSVGQKQLVCLCRALVNKAKILIMDEATASVDVYTDSIIKKTLTEECVGMTILIIAHRLDTLQDCAKIIELESVNG